MCYSPLQPWISILPSTSSSLASGGLRQEWTFRGFLEEPCKSWTLPTNMLCVPRKEDLPPNLHSRIIILAELLLDQLYCMVEDITREKKDLQEKQRQKVRCHSIKWTKILYYFNLFYVYLGILDVGFDHHSTYYVVYNSIIWWFCIIFW